MKKLLNKQKIELAIVLIIFIGSLTSLVVLAILGLEKYARHLSFPVVGSVAYLLKRFGKTIPLFTKKYSDKLYEAYYEEMKYAEFPPEIQKEILKGLFYLDIGKEYFAIRKFTRTLEKCFNDVQKSMTVFFIGVSYKELKLFHKAVEEYERALDLHSGFYKMWRALGWVYNELKENAKAKQCVNKALEINAKDAIGYNNIAYEYLMQENYEEAIKNAVKAIELKPAAYEPHSTLAICYAHMRDVEKVKHHYNQLVTKGHPDTGIIKDMVTKILYDLDIKEVFDNP